MVTRPTPLPKYFLLFYFIKRIFSLHCCPGNHGQKMNKLKTENKLYVCFLSLLSRCDRCLYQDCNYLYMSTIKNRFKISSNFRWHRFMNFNFSPQPVMVSLQFSRIRCNCNLKSFSKVVIPFTIIININIVFIYVKAISNMSVTL